MRVGKNYETRNSKYEILEFEKGSKKCNPPEFGGTKYIYKIKGRTSASVKHDPPEFGGMKYIYKIKGRTSVSVKYVITVRI